ncbi:MAG: cytochrome c [Burkholderiales bacterium]|nr:cytochrome c [Burkholderiales bacterium]MDE1929806.1 cytochrome c [Burkholderiales bacterium]MDE2158920.1 cytochrome c [Burkholderiales bacterium]MDE2503567.1 cytochrome c [Burkholderiales bacterium]
MSLLCAAAIALALPAFAQSPAKAQEMAIKYRQAAFTLMGAHFGALAAMAKGKVPFDAKVATDNANLAVQLSRLPFSHFIPGSDKGHTAALPKIWTEKDKFEAKAKTMQDAMVKVDEAAKAGNLEAFKSAVGETGKACKSCHDDYRKES